jgi:hypothetical protein
MSPRRAGAVVPNALSFARTAVRELVKGRWRIEKDRFDLDAEGRGEILYRLVGRERTFHFFLVSLKLDEAMKMDRNWAQSWDAMGVLCQGDWTPEREALLRREVPKQRNGYADYGTLVYARGNRSARVFDHVVESLAAGRQPDAALIAPVGYILRTTAFIANGQLGTTPLAALDAEHPFRRPYHIQMVSAWMLREFVFDLVDHIARARNPGAARLDAHWRRYLGLGNAAATGLVPFVTSHPHFMHRWSLANETALAQSKERLAGADRARFAELLERAIRHYRDTAPHPDGAFAGPQTVARDLERARAELARPSLLDWAARELDPEASEVLNAIAIELHPDLVAAQVDNFHVEERLEIQPEMTTAELRALLQWDYGWALGEDFEDEHYFWYRSSDAPRDLRRGIRGLAPQYEFETTMDTARKARALHLALAEECTVAELLAARPDLRHIVGRVQSLAGMQYAELRANWLGKSFSPFAPVRFPLAFKGMDKLETANPKSVRGELMQGAPIAEDVEDGVEGTWPFPPKPAGPGPAPRQPLPAADHHARPASEKAMDTQEDPRQLLTVAPGDFSRTVWAALQGHGAELGVAEEAAQIVTFAQGCGVAAVPRLLRHLGNSKSALLAAPAALDLACAKALATGSGVEVVDGVEDPSLLGQIVLRAARRGLLGMLLWRDGTAGYAISGPGPWFAWGELKGSAEVTLEDGSFAIICRKGAPMPQNMLDSAAVYWDELELRSRLFLWQRDGLTLPKAELEALYKAGGAIWVPAAGEPRLRPGESTDALKNF